MSWKKQQTWLKGGIIGLVIPPFLLIILIFLGIIGLGTENYDIPIIPSLMMVVSALSCPLCLLLGYFIKNSIVANILMKLYIPLAFVSWFSIGSIIGFFISMVKKK